MIHEITEQIRVLFEAHRAERRELTIKAFQKALNDLNSRNMLHSSIAAENFGTVYSNELNWRIDNSWNLTKEYLSKHDFLFEPADLELVKSEIKNCTRIEANDLSNHAKSSLRFLKEDYQSSIDSALNRTKNSLNSKINGELTLYKQPSSGETRLSGSKSNNKSNSYVALSRIEELKKSSFPSFDLSKLIRLCEELNIAYENDCFLSIPMILRTILNHIPPIFGYSKFTEVANNYGGKNDKRSLKKSIKNLDNSLKNIADIHLHQQINKKEALPNFNQINFIADLDLLLSEIITLSG